MECSGCRARSVSSGGDSGGEPPVPIPNTEVKPASADGTWGSRPWESRSPPGVYSVGVASGRPPRRVRGEASHAGSPSASPYGVNMATIGGASVATGATSRRASRSSLQKGGAELPRWVRDELVRVTPKERRDAALQLLTAAAVVLLRGPLPSRHVEAARGEDALPTHGDGA